MLRASIELDLAQLRVRTDRAWTWEPGEYRIEAARWAGDPAALSNTVMIDQTPADRTIRREHPDAQS
jgi:hypothetical protein